MRASAKLAVVVVAHPRSGTHLTIDVIRRNFPEFNQPLLPWQSAKEFLVCLDDPDWQEQLRRQSERSDFVILQSHKLGISPGFDPSFRPMLEDARVVYIYPFRSPVKTLKSYAELKAHNGPISAFLDAPDPQFGTEMPIRECFKRHAEHWMEQGAVFLHTDDLIKRPQENVGLLKRLLPEARLKIRRRPLPRHKPLGGGRAGEILQRILGRESTEVCIPYKLRLDCSERAEVDSCFFELYATMLSRAFAL